MITGTCVQRTDRGGYVVNKILLDHVFIENDDNYYRFLFSVFQRQFLTEVAFVSVIKKHDKSPFFFHTNHIKCDYGFVYLSEVM